MKTRTRISIIDVLAVLLAVFFLYTLPPGRSWVPAQQVAEAAKSPHVAQQRVALPADTPQPNRQTCGAPKP